MADQCECGGKCGSYYPTPNEALRESIVLWKELTNPKHYEKEKEASGSVKKSAVRACVDAGELPARARSYAAECPLCQAHRARSGNCISCPWPSELNVFMKCCAPSSPFAAWKRDLCPENARAVLMVLVDLYTSSGKDAADKCSGKKTTAGEFKVWDRVKLVQSGTYGGLDITPGNHINPPLWGREKIAGTVCRWNDFGYIHVKWDDGRTANYTPYHLAHLTDEDRHAQFTQPMAPGDLFKYWRDTGGGSGELHTLLCIGDGSDDDDTYCLVDTANGQIVCERFDPEGRYIMATSDLSAAPHGFDVEFDRLVPIGRATIKAYTPK